ncbi:hypothetical protein [Synechocystis sp. PCC 7509]|uniref:hypothetical protein n=1 Tax=Synechocystis sp. PCC 7509 TaxID=927677 RepID=UPI0002ABBA79|nr:hypothetical protein [Synechocystis sp. PCC 7509]
MRSPYTNPILWDLPNRIPTEHKEAKYINPLERFVTVEAIALLLKVDAAQIKYIRCWARVVLVVGVRFSRFVSYADLPPIVAVEAPNTADIIRWRSRWNKNTRQAPQFWLEFYKQKFEQSVSVYQLYNWGKIVGLIKVWLIARNTAKIEAFL